eukprot:TRINITY_DN9862_c0_g1_i3.p1 TRINITY_DN9862_c0_g1~~TRINITY_DN9862_c0_g1_i3.p1  ORF type:complete len:100 (+),score=9.80 TRINITY_DN9862_c0_g1_i3:153-452(+)
MCALVPLSTAWIEKGSGLVQTEDCEETSFDSNADGQTMMALVTLYIQMEVRALRNKPDSGQCRSTMSRAHAQTRCWIHGGIQAASGTVYVYMPNDLLYS